MSTSLVQIRVDETLKNEASAVYEELGLDLPTAIRIFLKRSVQENGIPFKMVLPKKEYTADDAVEAMKRMSKTAEENNISDMSLEDINAEIAAVRNEKLQ